MAIFVISILWFQNFQVLKLRKKIDAPKIHSWGSVSLFLVVVLWHCELTLWIFQ